MDKKHLPSDKMAPAILPPPQIQYLVRSISSPENLSIKTEQNSKLPDTSSRSLISPRRRGSNDTLLPTEQTQHTGIRTHKTPTAPKRIPLTIPSKVVLARRARPSRREKLARVREKRRLNLIERVPLRDDLGAGTNVESVA